MNLNYLKLKALKIKLFWKRHRIPGYFRRMEDVDFSPVCIIGTNRSGTSIVSSVISQHPQLEGIFGGHSVPVRSSVNGHYLGFCESNHVWDFLIKAESDFNTGRNEGPLWGHPKHISQYYRDRPQSKKEALLLANAMQSYRRTNKIPLLKDQWNILRIGLIRRIFPKAKFILVIRDYKDYIQSCSHKWAKDNILIEKPNIGLHWLTLNTTAIYDLNKHASRDFCMIDYASLFGDKKAVNAMLNEKIRQIGLDSFFFNLDSINKDYKFFRNNQLNSIQTAFAFLEEIISSEHALDSGGITKT